MCVKWYCFVTHAPFSLLRNVDPSCGNGEQIIGSIEYLPICISINLTGCGAPNFSDPASSVTPANIGSGDVPAQVIKTHYGDLLFRSETSDVGYPPSRWETVRGEAPAEFPREGASRKVLRS